MATSSCRDAGFAAPGGDLDSRWSRCRKRTSTWCSGVNVPAGRGWCARRLVAAHDPARRRAAASSGMSSRAGKTGTATYAAYCASKFAVIGFIAEPGAVAGCALRDPIFLFWEERHPPCWLPSRVCSWTRSGCRLQWGWRATAAWRLAVFWLRWMYRADYGAGSGRRLIPLSGGWQWRRTSSRLAAFLSSRLRRDYVNRGIAINDGRRAIEVH